MQVFAWRHALPVAALLKRRPNWNPQGTGCLVAPNVILTAQHVAENFGVVDDGVAAFDVQQPVGGGGPDCGHKLFQFERVLEDSSDDAEELDYAFIRVKCDTSENCKRGGRAMGAPGQPGLFGYARMRSWLQEDGDWSAWIGHPRASYKRISVGHVGSRRASCFVVSIRPSQVTARTTPRRHSVVPSVRLPSGPGGARRAGRAASPPRAFGARPSGTRRRPGRAAPRCG